MASSTGWRDGNGQLVAEPLWVLAGGKVAFLVWSPLTGFEVAGMVENPNWLLRVYDPRSGGFQDVARFWYSTDVAVGVYAKNNLLRAHRELIGSSLFSCASIPACRI